MGLSWTRVNIETTPGRLEIETRNAQLELSRKQISLNIHTELPKVEIDQSECFASEGLKGSSDFMREVAQRGNQQALEFIGKVAKDGDMLSDIGKGGNAIVAIAMRDSNPQHEFGIVCMPSVRPQITVTGEISFNPDSINGDGFLNGISGTYIPNSFYLKYTPSQIRMYTTKSSSNGLNVDTYI